MAEVKLSYPTNFEIVELSLMTASKGDVKINLVPYLVELNLFEDIFSPTISAQIVVSDAIAMSSNFRMNGTEFVNIGIRKFKGDKAVIYRTMRLYKISNRKMDSSLTNESYTLNCCSEEFMLSEQYRISKSYKKTTISDIVTSILQNYIKVGTPTTKNITVEPTDGVYDFILPNKKLFETINWLSVYALPKSKNTGADMLFFENTKGYYFTSLQSLYKQESYIKYFFNPKNVSKQMGTKVVNARSFQVLDSFDVMDGISSGAFTNRVLTLDPLTKSVKTKDFEYGQYNSLNNTTMLNGYSVLPIYTDRLNKTIGESPDTTKLGLEAGTYRMSVSNSQQKKKVTVPDAVANDYFVERYLPNRVAQLALSNYIRIKIEVPGNNELSAGMAIDFSVPTTAPVSSANQTKQQEDPIYSGKYIITAVRHMIKTNPSAYVTILELAKDSFVAPLPSTPSTSMWTDAIKGIQNNVKS